MHLGLPWAVGSVQELTEQDAHLRNSKSRGLTLSSTAERTAYHFRTNCRHLSTRSNLFPSWLAPDGVVDRLASLDLPLWQASWSPELMHATIVGTLEATRRRVPAHLLGKQVFAQTGALFMVAQHCTRSTQIQRSGCVLESCILHRATATCHGAHGVHCTQQVCANGTSFFLRLRNVLGNPACLGCLPPFRQAHHLDGQAHHLYSTLCFAPRRNLVHSVSPAHFCWYLPLTMSTQLSHGRPRGSSASILRRPRQSRTIPSTGSSASLKDPTNGRCVQRCYQDLLPTEVWRHVLDLISILDLFSLYNTSRYMRALAAPFLVHTVASKSLRLYFYQEYVSRVGVKLVFDHFDLQRDRVVFRPQDKDHQYRFKCGLTIQSPQLEEIEVKNSTSVLMGNVQCLGDGRYYVRRDVGVHQATAAVTSPEPVVVNEVMEPGTNMGSSPLLGAETQPPNTATESPPSMGMVETKEEDKSVLRRSGVDEKGYQGTKNFMDKSCSVNIRKDGVHTVDGARHCFLQGYPWMLQYQVDYEPLETTPPTNANGSIIKKRSTFFFDVRAEMQTQQQSERDPTQVDGTSWSSSSPNLTLVRTRSFEPSSSSKSGASNSGPRFVRLLRFECSMNFLNPTRATRNIIGRWLEGKVHHWKKVLGAKKTAQLPHQQQHQTSTAAQASSSATRVQHPRASSQDPHTSNTMDGEDGHPIQPAIHDFDGNVAVVKAF